MGEFKSIYGSLHCLLGCAANSIAAVDALKTRMIIRRGDFEPISIADIKLRYKAVSGTSSIAIIFKESQHV